LSATVDHVAASPNLMIMVHIVQRLDVSRSPESYESARS
jgi:hypothetical protein